MGYALCGDVKEQCIFILWGTGANGKSTFLNTLQTLFGDYACSTATETFMKKTSEQSNDLARLKGMRLVTTTEIEQGKTISESLIKQITGEYRFDMDSVGTFIADCLEIDATLKWRLHTKLLYETYLKWCAKNNERAMCQKNLAIRMQEKGFKRMATNGQRVWLGLVIRNEWRV